MKKTLFILVAILFCSVITKSQTTTPPDNYFLPDYIDVDYCSSAFNYYNYTEHNGLTRGHFHFFHTGLGHKIVDRAQPCYTDTLLTIQGIAVGVNLIRGLDVTSTQLSNGDLTDYQKKHIVCPPENQELINAPKGKLKIMNGTLDREIASVDIDTNFIFRSSQNYSYLEYYFDNPVNMNGLFYIVEDVTITSTRLNQVLFVRDCAVYDPSLVRTAEDTVATPWKQWNQHPYIGTGEHSCEGYAYWDLWDPYNPMWADRAIPNTCQMYFFPIFAETDSTLGDGINFDTNDSTDMSLYNATVDRYSNVYPNPAKDIVTVQSSFKVREIEIHNALGQVVLRKQGSQNIETIDVSNLQSGTYIVRIKTQRGFANKKILIE